MSGDHHLHFRIDIGRSKPNSINNRETKCPFCDIDQLEKVIDRQDQIIFLENKFPVLEDCFQTLIIETDQCNSELSEYPKDHLHKLFEFGIEKWLEMQQSGEYQSVLFFKNHGPLSGGTIAHPHMQVVGLKNVDYTSRIKSDFFDGILIDEQKGVSFNISTKPKIGFYELNVTLNHLDHLHTLADYVQVGVHYLMNHFHKHCNSYNLFFYNINGTIFAKITPRFVTTPLYIGYSLPQVPNNLDDVVETIQRLYFQSK